MTAVLYNNTAQKERGCNFDIQKPQLLDIVVTEEKMKNHLKFSGRCFVFCESLNSSSHLVSLKLIKGKLMKKRRTNTLFVACSALVSFKTSLPGCGSAH